MSQGNACAAIGLANTNKIPMIGGYHTFLGAPGPAADGPYDGVNALTYWDRNPVGEDFAAAGGFTVPATSGVAAGKVARLVSTATAPMTVAADGLCAVSVGGVVSALATTGTYKTYIPAGTVIPAGSFLWVFLV